MKKLSVPVELEEDGIEALRECLKDRCDCILVKEAEGYHVLCQSKAFAEVELTALAVMLRFA